MRIARSMIYTQSSNGMNNAMNEILRLSEQAASQKRINRPSDDPSGSALVMDLQSHINALTQYDKNITTAKGWLDTANEQLGTISSTIIKIQELANQGSTGTVTDKQRALIATELRELQVQLIGLTNGDYAGNSLFAGAAVNKPAYKLGLGATVENANQALVHSVTGDAKKTIAVKFPTPTATQNIGAAAIPVQFSEDGGKTWKDATIPTGAGDTVSLKLGGVEVNLKTGEEIKQDTTIVVRPAAIYTGSIDGEAKAQYFGANTALSPEPKGVFSSPVAVRIENDPSVAIGGATAIEYSYSTDNGATWVRGRATKDNFLNIPGGQLDLGGAGNLLKGEQFVVNPVDSAIRIEISEGNKIQVNSTGANFFGGLYTDKMTGATNPVDGLSDDENLFEVVGNLIASLEMDDQEGVKKCLGDLKKANEHITTETGVLGGRQNRVRFAADAHSKSKMSTTARISSIQDVDVSQLSTQSDRAQFIYKSVLSTSAKVMNMSLLDYLR